MQSAGIDDDERIPGDGDGEGVGRWVGGGGGEQTDLIDEGVLIQSAGAGGPDEISSAERRKPWQGNVIKDDLVVEKDVGGGVGVLGQNNVASGHYYV